MKRARSFLLLFLGLIVTLCGLTAFVVYREHWQEHLNRDLIASVKRNDTKAVIALLNQGADANCQDDPPQPLAWWQILRDRMRGVKPSPSTAPTPLLLALTVTDTGLRSVGPILAMTPDNLPLVKTLLDHKAHVNATDEAGHTPLGYALMSHKKATVHLLLKYGADVRHWNNLDSDPLLLAVESFSDSPDVLSDMLQHGADVNQRDDAGDTVLFRIIDKRNIDGVRLLLSYHADMTIWDHDGMTPLWTAKGALSSTDSPDTLRQIIHLLLQAGAKE